MSLVIRRKTHFGTGHIVDGCEIGQDFTFLLQVMWRLRVKVARVEQLAVPR
jgi:hypothetical protein